MYHHKQSTCVNAEYVHIKKYTDDVLSGEYTGEASLYPGFDASYFTASGYDNNIVVDWDSDDVYYITPAEETDTGTFSLRNTSASSRINIAFFDNIGYTEAFDEKSEYIGFEATADTGEDITPFLVVYTSDNTLYRVKKADSESSAVIYREGLPDNCLIKAMVWDEAMEKPLINAIEVTFADRDSYPDNINNAHKIINTNHLITGNINDTNDTDCFVFSPDTDGRYDIKVIGIANITAEVYDEDGNNLSNENVYLDKDENYYIKLNTQNIPGGYILKIQERSLDKEFDIYEYDTKLAIYKKGIMNICEGLFSDGYEEESKAVYEEYMKLLRKDEKLHTLPGFLENAPKNTISLDECINSYFSFYYAEFESLLKEYKELVSAYGEYNGYGENGDYATPNGGRVPDMGTTEGTEESDEESDGGLDIMSTDAELIIEELTPTAVSFKTVFPRPGAPGNQLIVIDFNPETGYTTVENQYSYALQNKSRTINNLTPGGQYILIMRWTHNSTTEEGNYSLCRRIQLPYNNDEETTLYTGKHINVRIENEDRAFASDEDFNEWLGKMDMAYEKLYSLTGHMPYSGQNMELKSTREDLSEINNIPNNQPDWEIIYGWSGNPAVMGKAHISSLMKRLEDGDAGDTPLHEISHNFDSDRWLFDGEALAMLKMYYIMEETNMSVYRSDVATYQDGNKNFMDGWFEGVDYYDFLKRYYYKGYDELMKEGIYSGEGLAVILIDIQKRLKSWEAFKKTFRYFLSLSESQIPENDGEKLLLFLTKLKDYSGHNVISYISNFDKGVIEEEFDITLDYVTAEYPLLDAACNYTSEINMEGGGSAGLYFIAPETGNYYIYTAPYGSTGISNDTFIEVYGSRDFTQSPIAVNDDSGDRFSHVIIAAQKDTAYYITLKHYNEGHIHANLCVKKEQPIHQLNENEYQNINLPKGSQMLFSFTPTISGQYTFLADKYNGEEEYINTYLAVYKDPKLSTAPLVTHTKKAILWLNSGTTYYLRFSGYMMSHTKAKISVKKARTLEFKKRTDSSFIFDNYPECITRYDIVDGNPHKINNEERNRKIFEQKNISGENTFYGTHTAWFGNKGDKYDPEQPFYLDIDLYNPTDSTIYVDIDNLVFANNADSDGDGEEDDESAYKCLQEYYTGGISGRITIPPYQHKLLLDTLGHTFHNPKLDRTLVNTPQYAWARIMNLLFDFEVSEGGRITLSYLAAYDKANMQLKPGSENIAIVNGQEIRLDSGNISVDYENERENETDSHGKYKGYAQNQGAWIDAELEFMISGDTQKNAPLALYYEDLFYDEGIHNPNFTWTSSINPFNEESDFALRALPGGLHNFTYAHGDTGRIWSFDFLHHDIETVGEVDDSSVIMNKAISEEDIQKLKTSVAAGRKIGFTGSVDEKSLSMGQWGATYHYTITLRNSDDSDHIAYFEMQKFESLIFGYKGENDTTYQTSFNAWEGDKRWWCPITIQIPANSTKTFEVVMLSGGGNGGITTHIVIDKE